MGTKFVTLMGGPLDGETRVFHEGNRYEHRDASGPVHVYRASEDPARWDYDLEASTIETLRRAGEQKQRDRRPRVI